MQCHTWSCVMMTETGRCAVDNRTQSSNIWTRTLCVSDKNSELRTRLIHVMTYMYMYMYTAPASNDTQLLATA